MEKIQNIEYFQNIQHQIHRTEQINNFWTKNTKLEQRLETN